MGPPFLGITHTTMGIWESEVDAPQAAPLGMQPMQKKGLQPTKRGVARQCDPVPSLPSPRNHPQGRPRTIGIARPESWLFDAFPEVFHDENNHFTMIWIGFNNFPKLIQLTVKQNGLPDSAGVAGSTALVLGLPMAWYRYLQLNSQPLQDNLVWKIWVLKMICPILEWFNTI